ncbi:MAG: hypothetical protein A3D67_04590 [Candidatus Lloydbacteria bacterium RIFCSPHIGHO2_02_FULL_51_22]|uniref:NadR/Ttd14 AAA domain-containing protein n=3 Tax=Candidatus Lloydiibacteriota TaxID=1817910 RepID=A0A1G2DFD0_9BACT|nr:MAG: hypothetical protein A3D67_04590 [Candidatus Lloydbacteria bacterium RIFCSPHIGHO2_02_FULL_51_22]OGZ14547.1 MAG: hypothetical protein A3J08_02400 [Candidatus Lloydbacteria bacterium RIFCSPLOWO2_02_FULL_51_11]OGZ16480.1 MAG: hypothetical protein A3G11_02750 [Candidatus Lloydbacteria bacterium RIFCSPLOWO2_12_FULL_51_9]
MNTEIPCLAITGGPCGGKTTSLCYIEEKLRDRGYAVFVVKESATELMTSGVTPSSGLFSEHEFQSFVLRRILETEAFYKTAARLPKSSKKVIICDRGVMDGLAYMNETLFQRILSEQGLSIVDARDARYDAVFHLRSAALGAEAFYSSATNAVRRETPEEAREKDERTLAAWLGHPHVHVIDNSTDFDGKLKRLFQKVCFTLGIPVPMEIERKFFVAKDFDPHTLPVPFQEIEITQAYLPASGHNEVERIRKRGQDGAFVYYHTRKTRVADAGAFRSIEVERHISREEYERLFAARDPSHGVIKKSRFCFEWQNLYFELDEFHAPREDLRILEVELTDDGDSVIIPEFIPVLGECRNFTNEGLARGTLSL